MRHTIVVFDLDGTLIDTAPDLVDALNTVFVRKGLPQLPYDAARKLIGGGVRMMILRGLEAEGCVLVESEVERMFEEFIAYYSEHIADRSRPFPGLTATLEALAAAGCHLAVCTNKLERLSVLLLERLGLARHFSFICGQDTFGVQKPDPDMLRRTIQTAGGTLRNAIMVGDSINDIRMAHAAGVPVIAVDFGYTEQPVSELGPDRIISDFSQLPDAIAGLIARN